MHDGVITVRDAGAGISDDEAAGQRFRPGAAGGTGLGLAIAHQLAIAMGAQLSLHNRSAGGLEAQLVLPLG